MNFQKEAEIDAKLAALGEVELRAVAKQSIKLNATLLHNQQQLNKFMKDLAETFTAAGDKFGREYNARVVTQLDELELTSEPTPTKSKSNLRRNQKK